MIKTHANQSVSDAIHDGFPSVASMPSRLSSKRRLEVAEHLLDHNDVSEEYVNDIVVCAADMVVELESERRLGFILKIHAFIQKNGFYNGKDTFRFFSSPIIASLNGEDRLRLAEIIVAEISPNHVLSCEAHAWALSYVLPHVNGSTRRKELLQTLLNLAEQSSLSDMVRLAATHAIHGADPDIRGDLALFLADGLKAQSSTMLQHLLIGILDDILPLLGETLRVDVADSIAPLLFHANSAIARRALEFFAGNMALLPLAHRHPFAQMIMVLANDPALGSEAGDALEHVMESMNDSAHCLSAVRSNGTEAHSGRGISLAQHIGK